MNKETNPEEEALYSAQGLIGRQIDIAKSREDEDGEEYEYHNRRGEIGYLQLLQGLKHLFEYARTLDSSPFILDIGSGITKAISEIKKSAKGEGLIFKATVLQILPEISSYLGEENVLETSVEELKGVGDSSVSVALGVFSVGYSMAPEIAVKSIDRVLKTGGVFKGNFHLSIVGEEKSPEKYDTHEEFEREFRSLGYDVFVFKHEYLETTIMLVIKPGNDLSPSAEDLFMEDRSVVDEEVYNLLPSNNPPLTS